MWSQVLISVPFIVAGWELLFGSFGLCCKSVIGVLVALGLIMTFKDWRKRSWIALGRAVLFSVSGALLTFGLANQFQLGSVVASGAVGLLGARLLPEQAQLQLYMGAFVGMSSSLRFPTWGPLLCAAILAGILWEILSESWPGVGGRLGTIASLGVILTLLLVKGGL